MKQVEKNREGFEHHLHGIQEIVQRSLADVSCRVYLFGSRATGAAHPGSDADIAVAADVDVSLLLSQMRFALEESTIPYKVDLVDLNYASADFQQQVLAEGILIWKN